VVLANSAKSLQLKLNKLKKYFDNLKLSVDPKKT